MRLFGVGILRRMCFVSFGGVRVIDGSNLQRRRVASDARVELSVCCGLADVTAWLMCIYTGRVIISSVTTWTRSSTSIVLRIPGRYAYSDHPPMITDIWSSMLYVFLWRFIPSL